MRVQLYGSDSAPQDLSSTELPLFSQHNTDNDDGCDVGDADKGNDTCCVAMFRRKRQNRPRVCRSRVSAVDTIANIENRMEIAARRSGIGASSTGKIPQYTSLRISISRNHGWLPRSKPVFSSCPDGRTPTFAKRVSAKTDGPVMRVLHGRAAFTSRGFPRFSGAELPLSACYFFRLYVICMVGAFSPYVVTS